MGVKVALYLKIEEDIAVENCCVHGALSLVRKKKSVTKGTTHIQALTIAHHQQHKAGNGPRQVIMVQQVQQAQSLQCHKQL